MDILTPVSIASIRIKEVAEEIKRSIIPERGDKEFLKDIKEARERINNYPGEMIYDSFLLDPNTQDAVAGILKS